MGAVRHAGSSNRGQSSWGLLHVGGYECISRTHLFQATDGSCLLTVCGSISRVPCDKPRTGDCGKLLPSVFIWKEDLKRCTLSQVK